MRSRPTTVKGVGKLDKGDLNYSNRVKDCMTRQGAAEWNKEKGN